MIPNSHATSGAEGEEPHWKLEGLIPLSDPPREDTKDTVEAVIKMGVKVKMITGDQQKIAQEVARKIGMGTNILKASELPEFDKATEEQLKLIEESDGFAEVLPEHKYNIVKALRKRKHIVGMTGKCKLVTS